MGLQDVKQSEKENGEKVEKEKKDELEQKKGKLPGLFGEVVIYLSRNSFILGNWFQHLRFKLIGSILNTIVKVLFKTRSAV